MAALFALVALALFSCSNMSGGGASSSKNSYPVVRFVANMQSDLATAPQEISGLVSASAGDAASFNDGISRSAMPEIAIDAEAGAGVKYYVEAVTGTVGTDSYKRHFVYGTTSTLELGLESGKTWSVTCGIGEIGPEDSEDPNSKKIVLTNYMSDNDPSVTITPDNPVYVKTFGLKPSITTDGTGTIELRLKTMAETWYVKVSCSAQGWKDANEGAETIVLNGNKTSNSPILQIHSIKSGIYDVVFKFYDDKDALNYCTVQSINVFDDMKTSVWRDDGSGAVMTVSGQTVFNVTESVINLFTQTTMYVGDTGLGGLAPNDQNSGTAFEPLATMQEAAYRIKKYGQGADYTIFVSGTVQGCTTFDDDITSGKAKTITIMGYNDSGDKLKGYASKLGNIVDFNGVSINTYFPESKEFNPVITVKTAVPITIQNVDICEGASNGGSGLCIDGAGCSVTIKDGVTISGNKTGKSGGGVLVRQGKFYMKGGVIEKNVAFNSLAGNCNGGGVCLRAGAYFEMTGGEIRENRACMGGGVGLVNFDGDSGSNKFSLKRGKISQNIADGFTSSNKCGFGGGIMIMSGSETVHHQVTMTGGEISGNKVNCSSSAVDVSSGAIFEMTGGVIKENSLIEGESDEHYHAIEVSYAANDFCLGGAAYIPAGSGKNHCVYLNGYKKDADTPLKMSKINVDSNLSRHSQSDPLVIQFNTSGDHAARRGSTVASASFDLTDAKEYIVPASDDWNLKLSSDKKSLVLDAPIWVAGEDRQKCTGTPSEDGPGTKSAPYKSIYYACAAMTDPNVDYTIYIDGKLTGPQETPYMATPKAASITIQGANGDNSVDVLDGNGCNEHVLTLYAQADTTIKDLKITGANITTEDSGAYRTYCGGGVFSDTEKSVTLSSGTLIAGNRTVNGGGGVYKENGKLIIEDGAEISGSNMAANGGGVYLYNASLYMGGGKISGNSASGSEPTGSEPTGRGGGIYCDGGNSQPSNVYLWGKALVGRADISAPPTSSLSAHANDAMTGGGIYVYNGNLWLGYKDANKLQAFEEDAKGVLGGIVGNYATYRGGGVYIDCDVYNNSLYMASGQIACNGTQTQVAYNGNGGGIYIFNDGRPIVDISGGSVKNNRSYKGGAIYNDGSSFAQLKIGGAADIPYGTDKKNDVYLNNNYSPITLASSLSPREAKNAIAITLNTSGASPFTHGSTVFKTDPERLVSSDELNCVKLTAEHEAAGLALTLSSDCKSIKLDKPIYVRKGGTPSPDTADGTKTKPFASIADACDASVMTNASLDYTILVDGINPDSGYSMPLQGAQTIPATATAKSITIMGANGLYTEGTQAGQPKDALDGYSCSYPVLKALCACPVILGNIKITKAYNRDSSGGGVYREDGDLYIQEGTLITDNTAKAGYGVYMYGKTKTVNLYMSGGKITSNKMYGEDQGSGGAIYAGHADAGGCNVFIYGSTVIGGVSKSNPSWSTDKDTVLSRGGNYGANVYGGGVSCRGNLYLGYKSASGLDGAPTSEDEAEWTGAICGNCAGKGYRGGGVYITGGKLYMNSGEISYNSQIRGSSTGQGGGGIGVGSNSYIELSGGKIHHNLASANASGGGGVLAYDSYGMTFKMTGGEIYANQSQSGGGGVTVESQDTFIMSGGSIYGNQASGAGGGIYNYGKVFIYGSAVIGKDGDPVTSETSESVSNKATAWGGGICAYRDGVIYLGYKSASGSDGAPTSDDVEEWTGGIYCNSAQYGGGIGGWYTTNYIKGIYMSSGTIKGNYASESGGGVNNPGEMYMTGGLITKNHCGSDGKGSGVYIGGSSCVFQMSGPACILPESDGSNEFYAANKITIAGPLAPTVTDKAGEAAADYAACIVPKDNTQVLLEVANGLKLSDYAPLFKIKPQNGGSTLVVDGHNGLEYGIGADGKYGSMIYVTESSDDVCDDIMKLVSESSQDNPVNICFTTDFAPTRNVQHDDNDASYNQGTEAILRVPEGKYLNITASKPITIKKTYSEAGNIIYCENGNLSVGPNITLDGNGKSKHVVCVIGGEATFTGCEIKGSKSDYDGIFTLSGPYLPNYGVTNTNITTKVTINAGTKIYSNEYAGVVSNGNKTTVTLNGGVIYSNSYAGIWLTNGGTVICPDNSAVSIYNNKKGNSNCQVYFNSGTANKWGSSSENLQEYSNTTWATFPN